MKDQALDIVAGRAAAGVAESGGRGAEAGRRGTEAFSLRALASRLERRLQREGYAVRVRISDTATVAKALVGFVGLPAEAGLSAHADEVLWVKVEVDTKPPAGADLAVSVVDKFGLLRLQHHDLPSLFAGKLAAIMARNYTKGRDLYDLLWYLTRDGGAEPNLVLLGNALRQTAPGVAEAAEADWRGAVRARLEKVDWEDARRDVAPFLEQRRDVDLIAAETFDALLRGLHQTRRASFRSNFPGLQK